MEQRVLVLVNRLALSNQQICVKILTLVLLNPYLSFFQNTVDPDQLAFDEAI